MTQARWLLKDRLASFNDDTFRAELSPRRVAPDGNGGHKVVTPEEAKALEDAFTAEWRRSGVKPDKSQFVFVDKQERFFSRVWKLYELIEDKSAPDGKRFVRVGQCDTFDEVATLVPGV